MTTTAPVPAPAATTVPAPQTPALAATTVPAPQATGFFTLPREIRNAIYSQLLEEGAHMTHRQRCGAITFTLARDAYMRDKVSAIRNKQLAEEFRAERVLHPPSAVTLYISDSVYRYEPWQGREAGVQSIANWPLAAVTKVVVCIEFCHITSSLLTGTDSDYTIGWEGDCDDVQALIDSTPPQLAGHIDTEIRIYPTILSEDSTASPDSQHSILPNPHLPDRLDSVLAIPKISAVKIFPTELYAAHLWSSGEAESRLFGAGLASMVWRRSCGWQCGTG